MKYKGFFKHTNDKPTDEYIEIFVSDWNKEHWGFYTYISKDNYEQDLEDIGELMTKLNYRDGDVYIELINHSDDLENFYKYIYDSGNYTHSAILNPKYWEILEEKGDSHFLYFSKLIGSCDIEELENQEFFVYNDWYEVLETYNPELYKSLDEHNGFGSFDIEQYFSCQGFTEIGDVIVSEG